MTLRFASSRRLSTYLPPGATGEALPVRVWSEVRRDPLTGRSGRVAHFKGFTLIAPDLSRVVADSRLACPFCPERVMDVTPQLPKTAAPSGRIRRGEAVLFPNISPYDRSSVVTVLPARRRARGAAGCDRGWRVVVPQMRTGPQCCPHQDARRGRTAVDRRPCPSPISLAIRRRITSPTP